MIYIYIHIYMIYSIYIYMIYVNIMANRLIMLELAAWNVSNYFGCCMFLLRVVLPLDS